MIPSTVPQVLGLAIIFAVSWGVAAMVDSRPLGQVLIGLPLFLFASGCYVVGLQLASRRPPKT